MKFTIHSNYVFRYFRLVQEKAFSTQAKTPAFLQIKPSAPKVFSILHELFNCFVIFGLIVTKLVILYVNTFVATTTITTTNPGPCTEDGFFPLSPEACCSEYLNCFAGEAYITVRRAIYMILK